MSETCQAHEHCTANPGSPVLLHDPGCPKRDGVGDKRLEAIRGRLDRGYTLPEMGLGQYEGVSPTSDLRDLLDRIEAQREVVEAAQGVDCALVDHFTEAPLTRKNVTCGVEDEWRRLRKALDNLEEQTDEAG